MTELKSHLADLLAGEPPDPDRIDSIVADGRRALRRHTAVTTVAGVAGAAALTAAVVVPIAATRSTSAGSQTIQLATQGSPTPAALPGRDCRWFIFHNGVKHPALHAVTTSERKAGRVKVLALPRKGHDTHLVVEYCAHPPTIGTGSTATAPTASSAPPQDAYHYTDTPQAISSRLGDYLSHQIGALGLTITYTRPFSQESSTLESGHPTYFGGNVDVRETSGYGDIGVQVIHEVTDQSAPSGQCDAAGPSHCEQTTLPDGSILRTAQVHAGSGNLILTAEVARTDGVIVQAQESNYPFGPDAATEASGSEPLTLDQLSSLAEDANFTF